MPTKLVPYTDAIGRRHWVEVSADVATQLDTFDRAMRKRERRYLAHVRTETDLRAARRHRPRKSRTVAKLTGFLNVELETAYRVFQRLDTGNPWEGPKYAFTHLIGSSPTWPGPGKLWVETEDGMFVCALCRGHPLARHQYCLNCDRSGRDE